MSDKTTKEFALWAMSALQLRVEQTGDDYYAIYPDERHRDQFHGAQRIPFTFAESRSPSEGVLQRITATSPLFRWMRKQLNAIGPALHSAPLRQPVSLHELEPLIVSQFTLDGVTAKITDFRLQDRPLMRLTFSATGDVLRHRYFDGEGAEISGERLSVMQIEDLAPQVKWTSRLSDGRLSEWIDRCLKSAESDSADCLAAVVVWCKWAQGRVTFSARRQSVSHPFADWAQSLVSQQHGAPAYACPLSELSSYHLAVDDQGRILPAEGIGVCSVSGKRVLQSELRRCEASGAMALPEHLETCPLSDRSVLSSQMLKCRATGLRVFQQATRAGVCEPCSQMQTLDSEDARIARLLDRYPPLTAWNNWRGAESGRLFFATAHRSLKKLLLVVNTESMETLGAGTGMRWGPGWKPVPADQCASIFSES